MAARPVAATFDCYGTLVDWEGGAGGFLYQLALRSGHANLPSGRELRDRLGEPSRGGPAGFGTA
jgi:predicted flavoprotein YhiN